MLDLVVRSDRVVTPHGVGGYDVAIQGDRIVAVAAPGSLTDDVGRTIDATGKIVVPGGVDPHIHAKWPVPFPGTSGALSAGPEQVSRAALFGGTTTLIDFAAWEPGETLQQTVERRDRDWAGQCCTDYAFHPLLTGAPPPEVLAQIGETVQAGFPSFKLFTTDITPSRRGRRVLFGHIWEVLQALAKAGGLAAIHSEDDDIVMYLYEKLTREGRTGFEHLAEVHNTLSEDLSFRRIIRLAELVGSALYMVHVSAASGVQAVAEARSRGVPIYGETLHQYANYTSADYRRPNGQMYHTYPSLKGEEDNRALWAGMANGTISTVATDEVCTTLAVKIQGTRIDDTTGGNTGVEPRMSIVYTEGVVRRGFSLERFVNLTSANAARILGLYPQKGAIAPGSDADLAIIDPTVSRAIDQADLHESDYSPWEGWQIDGWPTTTIQHGVVVVENGTLTATPAGGRLLKRKIAEAVLRGPVGNVPC
ncbi:MAG: amidohydrolase family protein [Chloroflexi bacterium]|nr:amidohydrolase family protein [Chloroflexota bacterium]